MPTCRCGGSVGKNSSTLLCKSRVYCLLSLQPLFTLHISRSRNNFLAEIFMSPDVLSDLINILVNETVNSCSSFVNILVCFCVCGARLQRTGSRCHRQILGNAPTPKEGNIPLEVFNGEEGKHIKMSNTSREEPALEPCSPSTTRRLMSERSVRHTFSIRSIKQYYSGC